jgi:hypothetical protein
VAFSDNVKGTSPKDVMDLLVLTQYFDTIQVSVGINFVVVVDWFVSL